MNICKECGAALPDSAAFCSKCGSPVSAKPSVESASERIGSGPRSTECAPTTWHFEKSKSAGRVQYKKFITDITMQDGQITIAGCQERLFRKRRETENTTRPISDIGKISVASTVDIWNLVLSAISAFYTLVCLIDGNFIYGLLWGVVTVLVMYTCYGYKLTITWKDGKKSVIPIKSKNEVQPLIEKISY